jgi:hypothetical protein
MMLSLPLETKPFWKKNESFGATFASSFRHLATAKGSFTPKLISDTAYLL